MTLPKYPLLVFFFLLFCSLATYFHIHGPEADYWSYAAVIQDIAAGPKSVSVSDSFRIGGRLGVMPHNYSPYLWGLAMMKRGFNLSPLTLLYAAGLFNFLLFAFGLHFFLKTHFDDPHLSFCLLPILLFFWGKSWDFSGAYDIGARMINLSHPSSFGMALGFFALAFFERYLRDEKKRDWIGVFVCLPIVILINLLPGVFVLGTMSILTLLRKNLDAKKLLWLLGLGLAALALVHVWPYYSLFGLLQSGLARSLAGSAWYLAPNPEASASWDLLEYLSRLGPALLGLPLIVYYATKRRFPLAVLGFTLFFVIFLICFLLKAAMGWRFVFYVTFFLHLAIALCLRDRFPVFERPLVFSKENGFAILLVFTAAACLIYQTMSITAKQFGFHSFREAFVFVQNNPSRGRGFEKEFRLLAQYIPADSVVLSDYETSLILTALGRKTVSFQNQKMTNKFFKKGIPLSYCHRVIKKYHAKYVLWNEERVLTPFPEPLAEFGRIIYQKHPLTLLNVR